MKRRFEIIIGVVFALTIITFGLQVQTYHHHHAKPVATEKQLPKATTGGSDLAGDETPDHEVKKHADKKDSKTKTIDWKKPSESKAYPNLKKHKKAFLKVSIADQRVYVMDGKKVLYTMYASTGSKESPTPTGTFHIESERGDFFYNAASKEGAKYWVSFKDHGTYLFHTVPTDKNGHFIEKEAKQLGQEAKSHGCVRMSVADAKWIYDNVPEGMKVEIH